MTSGIVAFEWHDADAGKASSRTAADVRRAEDKAMLRAAADLTRDLNAPKPWVYWTDLTLSVIVGWGALCAAIMLPLGWAIVAGLVSALALYRAGSFIHEVSHIKHSAVPGFRLYWNLVIGIPTMAPSFMYEGVHNLHHARTRYGTAEDPEYLPLALMKPWTVPVFVLLAALAPVALIVRFAVFAPLSLVFPPVRKLVVERYSALAINPAFRRRAPEGEAKRLWLALEVATSLWAIALVAMVVADVIPVRAFLTYLGVFAVGAVINQVRTLVAHLWENEGEPMSVTAQYLDSVNVPPPGMLPLLWAPVGLRYHALHHLLPGVPYHALGEAHRRLSEALGRDSAYHKASYPGLPGLVVRLVRSTMIAR
ncbi:fatty acid desaturase [Sphingomonas sp.]|uniref:fatty acid desaturase family protein n=1 Tax=Sphingomonas sp. TaxID=28214 RepID=UPI001B1EA005|nr:fatty acid desaturase [Sphingomonas sp.]MBO9714299.1 fatty acid desaturase [Sphingomonas sp.]